MAKRSDFRPAREWIDALPAERRAKIEANAAKIVAETHLAELRKAMDITQVEAAKRAGMKQSEISRIERAPETAQLRTMGRYAASLGAKMKIVIEFPDGTRAEVGVGRNGRLVKSDVKAKIKPKVNAESATRGKLLDADDQPQQADQYSCL